MEELVILRGVEMGICLLARFGFDYTLWGGFASITLYKHYKFLCTGDRKEKSRKIKVMLTYISPFSFVK